MRGFLKGLVSIVKTSLLFALLGSSLYLCVNMGMFQLEYTTQYDNAHVQMVREHERQLIVGEMIQSQNAWEQTALAVQDAYYRVKGENFQLQRKLYFLERDTYTFLRLLDAYYPGVKEEIIDKMNGEPTPAVPQPEAEPASTDDKTT